MEVKGRREDSGQLYKQKEEQQVELIDRILSDGNIEAAIHAVKSNRALLGCFRSCGCLLSLLGAVRRPVRPAFSRGSPRLIPWSSPLFSLRWSAAVSSSCHPVLRWMRRACRFCFLSSPWLHGRGTALFGLPGRFRVDGKRFAVLLVDCIFWRSLKGDGLCRCTGALPSTCDYIILQILVYVY